VEMTVTVMVALMLPVIATVAMTTATTAVMSSLPSPLVQAPGPLFRRRGQAGGAGAVVAEVTGEVIEAAALVGAATAETEITWP